MLIKYTTWVADPNACPKSIPISQPEDLSIRKFPKCRSPIPNIQLDMHTTAWEVANLVLRATKASGEDANLKNDFL